MVYAVISIKYSRIH